VDDSRSTFGEGNKSELVALVKKAVGGDYEAFGNLYTIFIAPIYRYVFYHVRDKMTAEDIIEEVFLKAWKAMPSCCGKEETFSSWLYRIAHNQVIDTFRNQQKQVPLDIIDEVEVSSATSDVEMKIEHQRVLRAVARLRKTRSESSL
jgi:RNA polymerase sigma-70 factor (ECF subfamily)